MKKYLKLTMCLALTAAAVSLTSCGQETSGAAEETTTAAAETTTTVAETTTAAQTTTAEENGNNILSDISKAIAADGRDYGVESEHQQGEEIQTSFFDFKVNDSHLAYEVADYVPVDDGYTHLCVNVTLTNTTDYTIPVGVYDFTVYWGEGEYDYEFALEDDFTEGQYPIDTYLASGETVSGDIYFLVPDDKTQFDFEYIEIYEDEFEGNTYTVKINEPEVKNSVEDYFISGDVAGV